MEAGVLVEAFECALNELGLADRNDPVTLAVAKHIIALAKAGACDPVQMRDLTVKAIRQEQRQTPRAFRFRTAHKLASPPDALRVALMMLARRGAAGKRRRAQGDELNGGGSRGVEKAAFVRRPCSPGARCRTSGHEGGPER
jgi:hypothetical protein